MKKLFFTALLATVALGGAFATNYWAIGSDSATAEFSCEGIAASCEAKYDLPVNTVVSTQPATGQGIPQPSSTFRLLGDLSYNP